MKILLDIIYNFLDSVVNLTITILKTFKIHMPEIFLIIATAFLTGYFTYYHNVKFEKEKKEENTKKIQQIVNAEIFENLDIANKYVRAKSEIASDVNFVSFLQDHRFYTDSIKDLMANNFQFLSEDDLYHLAIIRDKMNIVNRKLDKLEKETQRPPLSKNPECNFLYFLPEEKYQAHRFLNDDLNRLFYSIKSLSFFTGNPFPDLNDEFEIDKTKISVNYFKYNPEYKQVTVKCD